MTGNVKALRLWNVHGPRDCLEHRPATSGADVIDRPEQRADRDGEPSRSEQRYRDRGFGGTGRSHWEKEIDPWEAMLPSTASERRRHPWLRRESSLTIASTSASSLVQQR